MLTVQRFQNFVTEDGSARLTKWCFSITTVLISFMSVKITNDTLSEKFSIQKSVNWCFASNFGHQQKPIFLTFLNVVDFQSPSSLLLKA